MFYARPAIEPLGWDLLALPTPDGSRNFAARTSDDRPLDFRFSSGWLTVERGDVGASPDDDMEEVLSQPISPFGIMDIMPEQLCDILGLTVNGRSPVVRDGRMDRGFDWSGRTTYWCSTHSMLAGGDAELLASKMCAAFDDAVLLQPVWSWQPPTVRCREIKFLMHSDEYARFAIGCDRERLARILSGDEVPLEEFERVLVPKITLARDDHGEDLSGTTSIRQRGAAALELDYSVIQHRQYRLWVEYETADLRAQAMMATLLRVFDSHFCRGLEIVDLETGAVIGEDWSDEEDTRSYSVPFREWCAERRRRYLYVGTRRDAGTTRDRFVGFRPVSSPRPVSAMAER